MRLLSAITLEGSATLAEYGLFVNVQHSASSWYEHHCWEFINGIREIDHLYQVQSEGC